MSLTIHLVGYGKEYFRKELIEYVNEVLERCGLPAYQDRHIKLPNQEQLPSLSWSWRNFYKLQFVAIQLCEDPTWRPKEDFFVKKASQLCYQKFYDENKSHLICCGKDYDGLFVPIAFPKNALLNCNHHLCYFGSSIILRDELKIMAYKLGFDLKKYDPYASNIDVENDDVLTSEKFMMFQLYQMAVKSIECNLIIEFN